MVDTKKAPEQWKVVSRDGIRTHLRGTEKDARKHVENHFPRIHNEDPFNDAPEPDVYVVAPDGTKHHFDGVDWVDHSELETEDENADSEE